jgi:two-component sensor histidine kinase
MGIHELTTNAVKHGAFAQPWGRLKVRWEVVPAAEGRHLRLAWREEGVPFAARANDSTGMRIIKRIVPFTTNGTTEVAFRPDGLQCVMMVPLVPAA